jgi:predicted metalloprotease with PDZ domain
MVHLAFPSMDSDPWIEEGLATYVEPLVRVRAGLASPDEIWKWLVWGLPKGKDAVASRGFENARTWAATYWGGALFAFEADLEIRRRTDNRKSLDDALRGIVLAGGNVTSSWSLGIALEVGDRAAGVPVLTELFAKMRKPFPPFDLDETFQRLGVKAGTLEISYDDAAPLSAIRRGITTGK